MYELLKIEELAETAHKYQIFDPEEIRELETEWDGWEIGKEVIEVAKSGMAVNTHLTPADKGNIARAISKHHFNPNKAQAEIRRLINEIQAMHAKIKRLRDKTIEEYDKAHALRREYQSKLNKETRRREKAEQTKPLSEQKRTAEHSANLELIAAYNNPSEDPAERIQELSDMCASLSSQVRDLKAEKAALQKELDAERKSKLVDCQTRKRQDKRFERAAYEAAQSEIKYRNEATARARRAAKAKQSPYKKAGTIAAVFAWLDKNAAMLEVRGGKADAIRKIQSMTANQEIPAPDIPTEKTVASWITQWQKQKSAC